jgi:hypothetical protein
VAGLKKAAAVIAAVLSVTSVSVPAEANRRCGYDRYGYNAPDFSGCYRYYREGWRFEPAYGPYPVVRYDAPPPYAVYAGPPCYYDNGYDMRVRLICPRGW